MAHIASSEGVWYYVPQTPSTKVVLTHRRAALT